GSSTVYNAPIDGSCWNGNGEYPNYVLNVDGSGDAVTVSYCAGSCDATCGGGDTDVYGCLDANATNYNPDATIQEEDQWGNLVCVYASCDDTPGDGCMYADGWGAFNDSFDAAACSSYGGTPCDGSTDPEPDTGVVFSGAFGGTVVDGNTYTNPTGSEGWAGFANEDVSIYPFSFPDGGEITFTGATSGTDVDVYFRFEYNPYPDTEPSFNTASVSVSGIAEASYSVDIPAQGANTYSSFLLYVTTPDAPVTLTNVAVASSGYTDPCADVTCGDGQSCEDGVCEDDPEPDTGVVFSGAFGGTAVNGNTYINPTGSEGWAGFANEDASLYPFSFSDGGEITFTGATSGTDVDVYFRFEYNPYPDTEPSFNTASVSVSGTDEASYSVDIPAQGANTYSSFLLYVTTLDAPVTLTNVAVASSGYTDPCADVTCGDGQECVNGECVGSAQIDLPVDFEGSTVDYTTTDFGGNVSSLVTDPDDAGNMAMQATKTNGAATWAGTTIGTPAGFATNIPLSLDNSIMAVRVWSYQAGTPIRLKVEDSNDPTHTCETETNTTVSGWQVLEFDFENQAPGTESLSVGLGHGWTYNMASIFFNFGTEGAGETYYFDDVQMCDACDGGGETVEGCMDPNATNYDADATVQAEDQWGNLLCTYASCDDVPSEGCMYADSFAPWNEFFGPADCTNYGGTPCEDGGGGGDLSSDVTFDLDGLDDCGFVSVTGTWDGWSGWGATTDTGMAASIPAGAHEFVILCVNTEGEWWNDIWSSSTIYNAPIDGSCWNGNSEYPNYVLNVDGSGAAMTVSYCAGSCDAACGGGDDGGGGGDLSSDVTFNLDGLDDCGFVSVTGTWDGWSGWGANTDTGMAASIPAGGHEFVILCVNTEGEWWNDIWGSSTIYNAPIDGSCWNGNYDYANYTLSVDGSGDAVTVSYCAGSCEETCSDDECTMGDVNGDGDVNVLDIVQIVGFIIDGEADFDTTCADSNGDGSVNVLDIVQLVNTILGRSDVGDATTGKLIRDNGALMLKANGYIGGVQMTLSHGADFTLKLTGNAFVADSRTVGNETKLVIVVPESEELFTFTGDFKIVDMIVANSSDRVNVTAPTAFSLSEAYPNPFNPTTSMTLAVPQAGNVSVQVYNIMGQVVATLASGHMDASTYSLTWDASNVTSGLYFVKAETAGSVTTQKLVLMK
ncbi:MAG: T9SS type A sorting domain-containing protein, partial [Candidatus Marinimicrobia bacterium]|nr:T9SS type A sorting domain-containing protein [Candidatus Neomarinimicrobiota bacterium]